MFKGNLTKVASLVIISTVLGACSASKSVTSAPPPEEQKIIPKFDYSPKASSKVGSSNLTIGLVSPSYGDVTLNMHPFEDMRKSMENDFEELLTSKGFKVRGPFKQVGEMLYNDKQNSDFIFLVDIDLNFKNIDRKYKQYSSTNWGKLLNPRYSSMTDYYYKHFGEGTIVCNLTLTATSSNFGEKLWKKNVTLPPVPFKYTGSKNWTGNTATLYDEVLQDNSVYNEIAKVLEKQYASLFDLVERQIDVEEMRSVAKEAHKVDNKKS